MVEPVAVVSPIAALRLGLVSMMAGTPFSPEVPDDPGTWLAHDDHQLILLAVAQLRDLRLVVDLRQGGTPVVVVLLPELSADLVRRFVLAGASSVAGWSANRDELVWLLEAARDHRSIVPTSMLQTMVRNCRPQLAEIDLQAEQIEWLRALARGETVEHLAERVAYSERELYRLLRSLYQRLGVNSRTEALIWAAHQGIVE